MIVRKIRPDEYKRAAQFCALAFEYKMADSDLSPDELLKKTTDSPTCRQDIHWQSQWAAYEDDDSTMLSTFTVIPYRAQFDGHEMLMMGVGGVATLPQYRKRGCIRACFEKALPDMHAQGAAFSYLYPFSTAFYRKFGYELGCERNRYKLKLQHMPKPAPKGSCRLLEPGAGLLSGIREIYGHWQNRYNLMTIDEDIEYQWVLKADPFREAEYTYVYFSESGRPKGFMTYRPVVDEGDRTLDCTRFCFVDSEGFLGLLALLMTLAADHTHAAVNLPVDISLEALLPEWSFGAVSCRRQPNGMARVVDVERVLRMARMRGTGDLIMEIADEQISENDGRFEVRFKDGATTMVRRTCEPADITLSIQEFSRLICGRLGLEALPWLKDVHIRCDVEKAAQVFYQKPVFINRYF